MVTILMKSTKIATLGLLKIKVFWNRDCDIIISTHDVTNKILPRDSNYTVDVVMCPNVIKTLFFIRRKAAEVALFLNSWHTWQTLSTTVSNLSKDVPVTLMMMMMMMNFFCLMVDRQKTFTPIFSPDHCQRSSPSQFSNTLRAGFEPPQNLSSDLVE